MDNYTNKVLPNGNDNFTFNQYEHSTLQHEARNVIAAFDHGLVSGDDGKKEWTNGDHLQGNYDEMPHAPARLIELIYVTCFAGNLSPQPQTVIIPDDCFAYEITANQICLVADTSPKQWTLGSLTAVMLNGNNVIMPNIPTRFTRRKGNKELYLALDAANVTPVAQTFVQVRFIQGSNGANKDFLNWL
jgi:hypothetical protein